MGFRGISLRAGRIYTRLIGIYKVIRGYVRDLVVDSGFRT